MRFKKLAAAALAAAGLGLAGCAATLPTKVTPYSPLPAPPGQSFYVVPADGQQGGLEFGRYAAMVGQALQAQGYTPAGAPQVATMLVKLDYDVGEGETRYTVDPFARSRYGWGPYGGFYDPFYGSYYGRPYFSRWSRIARYRSPFYWGWDDPFWYASPYAGYGRGFRGPIREYTVYESQLDLDIVRRVDNAALFEGTVKARSQTDELGVLVPNLIEAMFTNFPGRNGETVKITVPAKRSSS